MFKRKAAAAVMAFAVVACAMPASAGAEWKHGHSTPIQQDQQFGITGFVRFEGTFAGKATGIDCQITSRVKLTASQTTGHLETMAPHPSNETTNCKGFGALSTCQVHNLSPQTPNWVFHTAPWQTQFLTGEETKTLGTHQESLVLKTQNVSVQTTGAFCLATQFTVTPTDLGIVPAPEQTVELLEVDAISQVHVQTAAGQDTQHVAVYGWLEPEGFADKTYSV